MSMDYGERDMTLPAPEVVGFGPIAMSFMSTENLNTRMLQGRCIFDACQRASDTMNNMHW